MPQTRPGLTLQAPDQCSDVRSPQHCDMPEPVSQLKNYSTDPPGVTIGTANTKHKYGNNARRYRLHLANANNERNMHTPDCQRAPQRSRQNSHNEHHHRHYAAGAHGNKPCNLPPVRLCGVHEYVPEMTTRKPHMCHPSITDIPQSMFTTLGHAPKCTFCPTLQHRL